MENWAWFLLGLGIATILNVVLRIIEGRKK